MPLNTIFTAAASGALVAAGLGILALVLGPRRNTTPAWLRRRLGLREGR